MTAARRGFPTTPRTVEGLSAKSPHHSPSCGRWAAARDERTRDDVCERLDGVDELLRMSLDESFALEGRIVQVMRSAIQESITQLNALGGVE